ncbi:MAG: hypothetical protein JO210_12185, partial [Acidobacteriaceae bacterium]|nr:hypothetical protein [Acidobacteriaceae bacterium]
MFVQGLHRVRPGRKTSVESRGQTDAKSMPEKKRGGGPKTPQGKGHSSQNSTKHGLRAKKVLILAGEAQEEYDRVVRGWNEQWEPADYQEEKLVETLIQNDWLHRRAQRWQLETEARVVGEKGPDPMDWTPEQQHKMELMQRYKTTAERAFYRAWSALQGLGKDIVRRDKDYEAMRLRVAKHELREEAQKLKAEKESVPRSRDAAATSRRAPKTKKIVTLD